MKRLRFSLQAIFLAMIVASSLFVAWSSDQRRREAETTIRMLEAGRAANMEVQVEPLAVQLQAALKFAYKKGFGLEMDQELKQAFSDYEISKGRRPPVY